MIFCFSGTGNSRYIAARMAHILQEPMTDLNAAIRAGDHTPVTTGHDATVVVPTYAWRIPRVVSDWLSRTELVGAERIWFVMSCGSEIGDAAKYNRRLARQKHLSYMGTAQIVMPENYIALFNAPGDEEARKIVRAAGPAIDRAAACIRAGESLPPPRRNLYDRFMSTAVNPVFYPTIVKSDAFRVSASCVGCGQCVRNCPTGNIRLENGKPVWGKNCTHCMACICRCPVKAIEYGQKSIGKPRYFCERLGL